MFYVAAAVYFFGAAFYLIFAKGELQPWAEFATKVGPSAEEEAGGGLVETPKAVAEVEVAVPVEGNAKGEGAIAEASYTETGL